VVGTVDGFGIFSEDILDLLSGQIVQKTVAWGNEARQGDSGGRKSERSLLCCFFWFAEHLVSMVSYICHTKRASSYCLIHCADEEMEIQ
jgi:hypothetical protein